MKNGIWTFVCEDNFEWVYDCGWNIKGSPAYRDDRLGFTILEQPVGISEFYREFGILPPKRRNKK